MLPRTAIDNAAKQELDHLRIQAPAHSEEAIAMAFAERHAGALRYVAKWGKWFVWNGTCWREDVTRKVFSLSRLVCREFAMTSNRSYTQKQIASAKTRAAVVSLASDDRRLTATIDQWDKDPWLLNTPNGVVDLRTGQLRPHQITDYMTKMTAVSPSEGDCPKWQKFLAQITNNNVELQKYLQRISGYCLTGSTSEQALFFNYGTGGNGKGRFVYAISGILHDYHVSSAVETFTVSKSERHPTELAKLVGARLVTATETEEGRRWAEARIKELTGGDPIDARFMHKDFFTYFPQFKLMFSGNHMPTLRSVNKAIARRFNRIPFEFTVPDSQINKNLDAELKEEWSRILAWMIEGCLQWQRSGLDPPEIVVTATADYLEGQDVTSQWIEECCEDDVNAWTNTRTLYTSWKQWAEQRNEPSKSEKAFSMMLEDWGLVKSRGPKNSANGFPLRLKTLPATTDQATTFCMFIAQERDKAVRASFSSNGTGAEYWLPRSGIIHIGEAQSDGRFPITIARWLVEKEKLEAAHQGAAAKAPEEDDEVPY